MRGLFARFGAMKTGRLILVPSPLGPEAALMPPEHQTLAASIEFWVVENPGPCLPVVAKLTGHKNPEHWVLERGGLGMPLLQDFRNVLMSGKDVGLICDAGLPAVADPGQKLVAAAHSWNIEVLPLIGPSSIMLGLMASGLSGQQFRFLGYLEKHPEKRKKQLISLSKHLMQSGETQIFIETPYRNPHLLKDLVDFGDPGSMLCLAKQLQHPNQSIKTQSLAQWKKEMPVLQKQEVLFLWGKKS
jgi:16S rRNA (cytidine1402-2'-O)-methyltransferase